MLQCCGVPAPVIPILTNPLLWLLAATAIVSVVGGKKKK